MKEILFGKIPKINIKFKNSFELEAEKEKEDEMKYILDDDNILEDGKNICYIRQKKESHWSKK